MVSLKLKFKMQLNFKLKSQLYTLTFNKLSDSHLPTLQRMRTLLMELVRDLSLIRTMGLEAMPSLRIYSRINIQINSNLPRINNLVLPLITVEFYSLETYLSIVSGRI